MSGKVLLPGVRTREGVMIAVVNTGPVEGYEKNLLGLRRYEVCINHEVIATFEHRRSDGLGRCLMAAAKAVEQEKWKEIWKIESELEGSYTSLSF